MFRKTCAVSSEKNHDVHVGHSEVVEDAQPGKSPRPGGAPHPQPSLYFIRTARLSHAQKAQRNLAISQIATEKLSPTKRRSG